MKRLLPIFLLSTCSLTALSAPLTIVFDVNINRIYNYNTDAISPLNITTQYTVILDTDNFTFDSDLIFGTINNGTWTFGSQQSEIDNFRGSFLTNVLGGLTQYSLTADAWGSTLTASARKDSDDIYSYGDWTDLDPIETEEEFITHRIRELNINNRSESFDLWVGGDGENILNLPFATSAETLVLNFQSLKNDQQEFHFFHQFYALDMNFTCHEFDGIDNDECYQNSYINSFYDYNGSAKINSISVGEVSEVPVPAAAWLMGSGLLGLTAAARRKKV